MADQFGVKLKGFAELERTLKRLGKKGKSIVTSSSRAGSQVFKKRMQANLPAEHKNKLAGPYVKRGPRSPYKTIHQVGTSVEHWQLVFLEWGVPPHEIKPRSNHKALRFGDEFATKIKHPGVRELKWMRRAFYSGGVSKALKAYKKKMWERIRKETK